MERANLRMQQRNSNAGGPRNGSVVALTNGAAEQTCHSAAAPVVDYSYTLLQMVGQE